MIDGIELKVCGLTSLADAQAAARSGADYLGFILFPKSPRYLPLPEYQAMAARLPDRRKVAVCVEPDPNELAMMRDDFDFFQIHYRHDLPLTALAGWAKAVGVEKLWLAPKLPPGEDVPPVHLRLSRYFVLDAFSADAFGGTGRTGDWEKFVKHHKAYPERTWILAGGLKPENIEDAVRWTGTRFVDVNSGVESAPGLKDHGRLALFVEKLRAAALS